ncbi:DUF3185 family protein [Algiphilus sp.]|uniref:DUF3185 family protein n=1 Tax=Algiphilus sp. TaxID=1872431 RepID=UPI0025C45D0B|nr:DUF3185 family protein [Algiphilus sp.]MCK5771118.1 DUF3185 family protein [Algiphilus sp.]
MSTGRIIGIALLVVGVILLYFGYNATQSGAEQIGEAITGNYSDETIFYLAAGAGSAIVGLLLAVFGGRRG